MGPRSRAARFTGWTRPARAPCEAPAHSVYTCVRLRLLLSVQPGLAAGALAPSRPTLARVEHTNPDDRTTRTRARTKAERVLSHGPCREARRWGGRARSGDGKTQRRSTREAGERGTQGESRARVRREELSGLRSGRGYGVRKGGQPCPGFAGSRWVRYQATFDLKSVPVT